MKRLLLLAALALVATQVQAQEQVRHIAPANPVVADKDVNSQPIPRLPDGTIDITGPWFGGGSNGDIEREGGLKPGELPLLPWAREMKAKRVAQRRTVHGLPADGRATRQSRTRGSSR